MTNNTTDWQAYSANVCVVCGKPVDGVFVPAFNKSPTPLMVAHQVSGELRPCGFWMHEGCQQTPGALCRCEYNDLAWTGRPPGFFPRARWDDDEEGGGSDGDSSEDYTAEEQTADDYDSADELDFGEGEWVDDEADAARVRALFQALPDDDADASDSDEGADQMTPESAGVVETKEQD